MMIRKELQTAFALWTVLGIQGIPSSLASAQSPQGTRAVHLSPSAHEPGGVGIAISAPAPAGSSANVQIQAGGPYAGSVPVAGTFPDTYDLSLSEAVQRGLRANLGAVSAAIASQQAQAQRAEARSVLLPNIGVTASENAARANLAAQGFSPSAFGSALPFSFPSVTAPFHYYDLHASAQQAVLDVTAYRNLRAQTENQKASRSDALQAREEVVLAVTGVYLQLMADLALQERQTAEVTYANASYKQARAQADAGNKAEIEASRSLVELQTQQQRLRSQSGEVQKREIRLARMIGLPLSTHIRPTEHLLPLSSQDLPVPQLIESAASHRQELQSAEAQVRAAEEARKAASAERLPTATATGTYGLQGTNPDSGRTVFQASAAISVPVFQGGRIQADIQQADAVLRQRQADLADLRGSVEAEVRDALIDLQVANDRVALADSNRKLATETLQQSQDRFSVGVADSVEVVNSEEALAAADHDFVNSLFSQHVARVSLAHATGEAENSIDTLFQRKAQ